MWLIKSHLATLYISVNEPASTMGRCLPFFNIRRGFQYQYMNTYNTTLSVINIQLIQLNNCQPYSFVGTQTQLHEKLTSYD